jgi:hypothetical protein
MLVVMTLYADWQGRRRKIGTQRFGDQHEGSPLMISKTTVSGVEALRKTRFKDGYQTLSNFDRIRSTLNGFLLHCIGCGHGGEPPEKIQLKGEQ